MSGTTRLGLVFDLRNPGSRPWSEVHRTTLDLIVEAERLGIEIIMVCEHHMFSDGYIPQPMLVLAAAAARTARIRLATGVLLAPLHSAPEIAEQAAVVDAMSGGRLELGLGVGYRIPEFELYGQDFTQRYPTFESRVHEIRRLWAEGGITPRPVQPAIPLWAGVNGPRGSRLAGRLGMGRMSLETHGWPEYLAGLEEGGHDPSIARMAGSARFFLADDPERALATLQPRIDYNARTYAEYGVEGHPIQERTGPVATKTYRPGENVKRHVLTPEAAAQHVSDELAARRHIDTLFIPGAIAGVIDDLCFRNVELAATRLRALLP